MQFRTSYRFSNETIYEMDNFRVTIFTVLLAFASAQDLNRNCGGKDFKCVGISQYLSCTDLGDGNLVLVENSIQNCPHDMMCNDMDATPCAAPMVSEQTTSTAPTATADPATLKDEFELTGPIGVQNGAEPKAVEGSSAEQVVEEDEDEPSAPIEESQSPAENADIEAQAEEQPTEPVEVEENGDKEVIGEATAGNEKEINGDGSVVEEQQPADEQIKTETDDVKLVEEQTETQETGRQQAEPEISEVPVKESSEIDAVAEQSETATDVGQRPEGEPVSTERTENDIAPTENIEHHAPIEELHESNMPAEDPQSVEVETETVNEDQPQQVDVPADEEPEAVETTEHTYITHIVVAEATASVEELAKEPNLEGNGMESIPGESIQNDQPQQKETEANEDTVSESESHDVRDSDSPATETASEEGNENATDQTNNDENVSAQSANTEEQQAENNDVAEKTTEEQAVVDVTKEQAGIEAEEQAPLEAAEEQAAVEAIEEQGDNNEAALEVTEENNEATQEQAENNENVGIVAEENTNEPKEVKVSSAEGNIAEAAQETDDTVRNDKNPSESAVSEQETTEPNETYEVTETATSAEIQETASEANAEEVQSLEHAINADGAENASVESQTESESEINETHESSETVTASPEEAKTTTTGVTTEVNEPAQTTIIPPCTAPGAHAYEGDCKKYFICLGSPLGYYRVEAECPPRFAFSARKMRCTRDIAPCGGMECEAAGNIADPEDPTRYFWCVPSITGEYQKYHIQCPTFQRFDPMLGKCGFDPNHLFEANHEVIEMEEDEQSILKAEKDWQKKEEKRISSEQKRLDKDKKRHEKEEKNRLKELEKEEKRKKKEEEKAQKQEQKLRQKMMLKSEDNASTESDETEPIFVCTEEGTFPDPDCCEKYFICWTKKVGKFKMSHMKCPPGYFYDSERMICANDGLVKCAV